MTDELVAACSVTITDPRGFVSDTGVSPDDVLRKARTRRDKIVGVLRVLTGEFQPYATTFWRDDEGEIQRTHTSPQTLRFRALPRRRSDDHPIWKHYQPC